MKRQVKALQKDKETALKFIQKLHEDKQRYAMIVSDQLNETADFLAQLKEQKPCQQEAADADVQPQDDWSFSS